MHFSIVLTILFALCVACCSQGLPGMTDEVFSDDSDVTCDKSKAAEEGKMFNFFNKIRSIYYQKNPYMVGTEPTMDETQIKMLFKPYNPKYQHLKQVSKTSSRLLTKLNNFKVDHKGLKPREKRLFHQFRYVLKHTFNAPYEKYFDGLYMLGPDYFCMQPICSVNAHFSAALRRVTPKTYQDLEMLFRWIKQHKSTFTEYLENTKEGVERGMVQPIEVCKAVGERLKSYYSPVGEKGPKGALELRFAQILLNEDYYNELNPNAIREWKKVHGRDFKTMFRYAIKSHFGQPLHNLIIYLNNERLKYCVPSDISSGLSNLPLPFVYQNGKSVRRTNGKLPTGDDIDVKMGYNGLLQYSTTSDLSAEQCKDLGMSLVYELYPKVISLAKDVTQKSNEEEAIRSFKDMINSDEYFYNDKPFPQSESNEWAFQNCNNDHDAKKNCPVRWAAIQKWFARVEEIMEEAKTAIRPFFHYEGPKKTVPDCSIETRADYNPSFGVPSYSWSDKNCTSPAHYNVPFFKIKMGPTYDDYNTNFHEARPGHHLQFQGYIENFGSQCDDVGKWIEKLVPYYPAFSEGWGLYSENPLLMKDSGILETKEKVMSYGGLKWQIWRALRLVVDAGLHAQNMTRDEALELFSKYAWDTSDTAVKEVLRYQGQPGQATSYMAGQQILMKLRQKAKAVLGTKFNLKDFHYYVLSQGQAPLDSVTEYIESWIECASENHGVSNSATCDQILEPKRRKRRAVSDPIMNEIDSLFKRQVYV